tara:strand:- start:12 stop:782 length:771 start_codon:yes stop_codon:yes gene_type:complete
MLPLSRMPVEAACQVTTLLFDLDGTFVTDDNLEAESYRSLERVRENGIKTIAVTGRPAGWCDLMARWWPVDSVVGENGALAYSKKRGKIERMSFHSPVDNGSYRKRLDSLLTDLLIKFPGIKLAADQSFRQWDLAVDMAEESEISLQTAIEIAAYCEGKGAKASISNIHVNIWFGDYNKQEMSLRVLESLGQDASTAIYIGDSPNDSPMFGYFPLSVGVRSVLKYENLMANHPVYVTDGNGSQGFVELVDYIISTR